MPCFVEAGAAGSPGWTTTFQSLVHFADEFDSVHDRRPAATPQPAIRVHERTIAAAAIWGMGGGVDKRCALPQVHYISCRQVQRVTCGHPMGVQRFGVAGELLRGRTKDVFHYLVGWRKHEELEQLVHMLRQLVEMAWTVCKTCSACSVDEMISSRACRC